MCQIKQPLISKACLKSIFFIFSFLRLIYYLLPAHLFYCPFLIIIVCGVLSFLPESLDKLFFLTIFFVLSNPQEDLKSICVTVVSFLRLSLDYTLLKINVRPKL